MCTIGFEEHYIITDKGDPSTDMPNNQLDITRPDITVKGLDSGTSTETNNFIIPLLIAAGIMYFA